MFHREVRTQAKSGLVSKLECWQMSTGTAISKTGKKDFSLGCYMGAFLDGKAPIAFVLLAGMSVG